MFFFPVSKWLFGLQLQKSVKSQNLSGSGLQRRPNRCQLFDIICFWAAVTNREIGSCVLRGRSAGRQDENGSRVHMKGLRGQLRPRAGTPLASGWPSSLRCLAVSGEDGAVSLLPLAFQVRMMTDLRCSGPSSLVAIGSSSGSWRRRHAKKSPLRAENDEHPTTGSRSLFEQDVSDAPPQSSLQYLWFQSNFSSRFRYAPLSFHVRNSEARISNTGLTRDRSVSVWSCVGKLVMFCGLMMLLLSQNSKTAQLKGRPHESAEAALTTFTEDGGGDASDSPEALQKHELRLILI